MTSHIANSVAPRRAKARLTTHSTPRMERAAAAYLRTQSPERPVYFTDPQALAANARTFLAHFPGTVAYAVKCNPEASVIEILSQSGINAFDVASLDEIRLISDVAPDAELFYMHPVKTFSAIREAYVTYGVRNFVLDTAEELEKIVEATNNAKDLGLFIRMALPKNEEATIDFSCKFGANPAEASALLRAARPFSARLGLAFHVGTQTLSDKPYDRAIAIAAQAIAQSGVKVDVLDIGGGFPADYDGSRKYLSGLPALLRTIRKSILKNGLGGMDLVCEPGRAMVANTQSLLVRVEQRRGNALYLNDGTYGGLADATAIVAQRFPMRGLRQGGKLAADTEEFTLFGPTCDSHDRVCYDVALPSDIRTDDYILIGGTGAYSRVLRTDFNGFGKAYAVML